MVDSRPEDVQIGSAVPVGFNIDTSSGGEMEQHRTSVALYARVSTNRQEQEATIQSQLEALRSYANDKGYQIVAEYVDDGYSGATLERPDLDRLREALRYSEFEIVLFSSPDRLARKAVYQGIILEDLIQAGVRAEFLSLPVDDTDLGKMYLGILGHFSEFERAKIADRTRRGKNYWARQGAMVGGVVPYGYRFVRRTEGHRASLEPNEIQQVVVKQMFRWLVEEGLSTRAIARRLTERGIPTARGAAQWQPTAVHGMLCNTVYKGIFNYQKAESILPSRRVGDDRYRHAKTGRRPRPREEWIPIPVPALVDEATWEAAQAQLRHNSLMSPRNNTRHQYLLRGLIRCPRCGCTYTGYVQHNSRGYRCQRTDSAISSTGQRCLPGAISAQPLEEAVWDALADALRRPEALVAEYERRLEETGARSGVEADVKQAVVALKRIKGQEDRITEAYINEAMGLERYKAEMEKLKGRTAGLERIQRELERRGEQERNRHEALGHLERFSAQVSSGLDAMTFEERQQLLQLVVERITVENGLARIETVIPTGPDGNLRTRHPGMNERHRQPFYLRVSPSSESQSGLTALGGRWQHDHRNPFDQETERGAL